MEEIGRDLLRYGRLVISKELFDSDGTPIRVRIFTIATSIGIPR